jgi:hypothetical protein
MINDIAVIKLHTTIKPTMTTQFACLPFSVSNDYPFIDTKAFIVGWGRVNEGNCQVNN